MQSKGFDQLPVTSATAPSKLVGLITLGRAEWLVSPPPLSSPHMRLSISSALATPHSAPPGNVLAMVAAGRADPAAPLDAAMFTFSKSKKFVEFTPASPLSSLSRFFETHSSALVTRASSAGAVVMHVVTKIDLLAYLLV
jgi:cystathionine beta-synthase